MSEGKRPPRRRQRAIRGQGKRSGADTLDASSNDFSIKILVRGRQIGVVQGDVFIKHVRYSEHFYRNKKAWCTDVYALKAAMQHGARWVELHDAETGVVFKAAISNIFALGFVVDEGYGRQIGLHIKHWSRGSEPVCEQLLLGVERDSL